MPQGRGPTTTNSAICQRRCVECERDGHAEGYRPAGKRLAFASLKLAADPTRSLLASEAAAAARI